MRERERERERVKEPGDRGHGSADPIAARRRWKRARRASPHGVAGSLRGPESREAFDGPGEGREAVDPTRPGRVQEGAIRLFVFGALTDERVSYTGNGGPARVFTRSLSMSLSLRTDTHVRMKAWR